MSKFIDDIKIEDEIGPHGLVIIKDRDGNILVRKHNMVVSQGKKIVFNKLIHNTANIATDSAANYKLSKLYFGNSMDETTYNYTAIDKIIVSDGGTEKVEYSYDFRNVAMMNSDGVDGHPFIEINLNGILCDPEKTAYISTLSVTADVITGTDGVASEEKLFSRIKFDPIPMVEGNELTLLYYIYF